MGNFGQDDFDFCDSYDSRFSSWGMEHLEASFDNSHHYVDEERVGDIVKIKTIIMISIIKRNYENYSLTRKPPTYSVQ